MDIRRFPWTKRLAADYAFAFDNLRGFYAGNPAAPDAWREAIARAQRQPRQREEVAAVLEAQQHRRDAPTEALAATNELRDPRTVAVVTGQQAGLFGGPLFTLLKAITAIRRAAQVRTRFGVPAVAIFWVHGEDHDWDEIKGCRVLDAGTAPMGVQVERPADTPPGPIARVVLDGSVETALAALGPALEPTEFTAEIIASLRRHYRPGAGMGDAFARWIERLLGPAGLIVFDGADPAAKPLVADLFAQEIASGRATTAAADASRRLEASGYHAQVDVSEQTLALFDLTSGRDPIRRHPPSGAMAASERQGETLSAGGRTWTVPDLTERARLHPEAFSPNVLLRPVAQDTLFPTVAYVGGPAEVAYYAQLRGVYEAYGVPMPLVVPRATATILDANAFRFLSRHRVEIESLAAQDESVLNALLAAQLPASVDVALRDAAQAMTDRMTTVASEVLRVDPTLEGAARSTLSRMQDDLGKLQGKIIQAAKRKDETLRRQFTHAQAQAFPLGHPQERAIGLIYFLNKFGPPLIDRLIEDLPDEPGMHYVMAL